MEKRLGIAQLCLLLAVLVFLSVTRGSPGEFHIPRVKGNAGSMREWGRRGLRLSSDWVPSRLRSASSGPPSTSNGSKTPTTLMPRSLAWEPVPASAPVIPTSYPMAPPPVSGPATATATTPTFRKKRPMQYLTPAHPHAQNHYHHHQHYCRPRSRSTHARHGHVSPTPVLPVQRSNSHHGTSFIGPVSRSVRRGARSSHLHEVRRIHHPHHHHHRGSGDEDVFITTAAAPATPSLASAVPSPRGIRSTQARPAAVATVESEDGGGGVGLVSGNGTTTTVVGSRSWGELDGADGAGAGAGEGAVDAWVDTDTDPDGDDDGQFQIDLD
jgi:hypothetical protein